MTDPQWANYYNTAISAGQSQQQAKAYADGQIEALKNKKVAEQNVTTTKKAANKNVTTTDPRLANYYNTAISAGQSQQQAKAYADSQVEALKKATDSKEIKEAGQKAGEWLSKAYNYVKPYVQKGAAIIAPTMLESTRKALKPMSTHYASQFMQDKAKNLQNKAAQTEADAQKNQQIANRDYKQASAEEAITAGSAAAMNTTAQMSGASGAAAAALAGQNAGNQATNNQYQSAIARNQGRSDERRDIAAKQRRTASDDRQMATQRMQDAATLDMTQREQDEYNKTSRGLSLGNDVTQNIIDNIYWRR